MVGQNIIQETIHCSQRQLSDVYICLAIGVPYDVRRTSNLVHKRFLFYYGSESVENSLDISVTAYLPL